MAINGRFYTVSFANVTLSAVQDLFSVAPGSSQMLAIQAITLGQITGATVSAFKLRHRYFPSGYTAGSGGSVPVPVPENPLDIAATFTAHANDTTQAISAGAKNFWPDVWPSLQGYYWQAAVAGRPWIIPPAAAFVLSLDDAPPNLAASGSLLVEVLP